MLYSPITDLRLQEEKQPLNSIVVNAGGKQQQGAPDPDVPRCSEVAGRGSLTCQVYSAHWSRKSKHLVSAAHPRPCSLRGCSALQRHLIYSPPAAESCCVQQRRSPAVQCLLRTQPRPLPALMSLPAVESTSLLHPPAHPSCVPVAVASFLRLIQTPIHLLSAPLI